MSKSRVALVGSKHCPPAEQVIFGLHREGHTQVAVELHREPSNRFDPNAIKVVLMLGYIAKNQAAELSKWLDANGITVHLGHLTNTTIEVETP